MPGAQDQQRTHRGEDASAGGFALRSRHWRLSVTRIEAAADLARRVAAGTDTAGEIAAARMVERRIDPVQTFRVLNLLFQRGACSRRRRPSPSCP